MGLNILVLGGTGPTGQVLIREALARGHTIIIFARSPNKIPEDISQNASVIIVAGTFENEEEITRAFNSRRREGGDPLHIDAVVSALGPPVTGIHSSGHPIAKAYERIAKIAAENGVKRFIVLGTASIRDDHDKFDVRFSSLIHGVEIFAPRAYEDIVEIGKVFKSNDQLDWTIARIPVLIGHGPETYHAGYVGDGKVSTFLTRPLFAKFVFDELAQSQWIRKAPLVTST